MKKKMASMIKKIVDFLFKYGLIPSLYKTTCPYKTYTTESTFFGLSSKITGLSENIDNYLILLNISYRIKIDHINNKIKICCWNKKDSKRVEEILTTFVDTLIISKKDLNTIREYYNCEIKDNWGEWVDIGVYEPHHLTAIRLQFNTFSSVPAYKSYKSQII